MPRSYGQWQTPQESKRYLDLWAERLRLPKKEQEQMTDLIKATIVNNGVEERMKEIDTALKENFDHYNPFFDEHGNEVDPSTGEVVSTNKAMVPVEEVAEDIMVINHDFTPRYIVELAKLEITDDDKAAILSIYDSPVNVKSFKAYINKSVDIYGGCIWYHPPFHPKGSNPDDAPMPGYNMVRLLTMDGDNPIIIEASFGALATHINSLLSLRGWFIWSEPVTYEFGQDEKTNAFRMQNTARVKQMLSGLKKPTRAAK